MTLTLTLRFTKKEIGHYVKALALAAVTVFIFLPGNGFGQAATSPGNGPASAVADSGGPAGKPHDDSFVIGDDDVLSISVWKEPDVSRTLPVRSDGKISIPLAGEVQAAGLTPRQLEAAIAAKLASFISQPDVTVIVTEIRSQKFNILGQVTRPGSYPLTNSMTVLDAIALAGGFRDFAKEKSIYVLRQDGVGGETRMPFNYKDVIKGRKTEENVKLQARDTIVVP